MTAMLKVTPNGANAKLGPEVGTTYRPVGLTCPNDCPLLNRGCYAQRGNVAIQQARSKTDNHDLMKLGGNQLVRHLVSGDWLKETANGRKVLDRVFVRAVIALHKKCPWLIGWGYTHKASAWQAAKITPADLPANLHVLASCHTLEEKTEHNANGWRTARVIAEREDKTADEILCPVDLQKWLGVPQAERTNCARCKACFATTKNIAFLKF